MRFPRFLIIGITTFFFVHNAVADEEEVHPLPQLPLQAPEMSAWRLTPVQAFAEGGQGRSGQRVIVRQPTGVRMQWFRGSSMVGESWALPSGLIVSQSHGGRVTMRASSEEEDQEILHVLQGGFPELHWVNQNNHQGVVEYEERLCHYFSDEVVTRVFEDTEDDTGGTAEVFESRSRHEAWIDIETGLPVAERTDGNMRTYDFEELTNPIPMPTEFIAALEKVDAVRERVRRRHAMPQR